MAAHPAWEGKAFEETSFNTVPEDLGEQLEQFSHEDFAEGRDWKFRFAGPTKKFRSDKATRELFLEYSAEPVGDQAAPPPARRIGTSTIVAALIVIAVLASIFVMMRAAKPGSRVDASVSQLPTRDGRISGASRGRSANGGRRSASDME